MLPDGEAVRAALLEPDGLASHLQPGALVVDMGSSQPFGTATLAAELAALGVRLIDAPVSGGVARAETGELAIMAGGEPADVDRARPQLGVLGSRIFHVGPVGAGHALKALNNFVSAAGLTAVLEALHAAERFGIDPETLAEVLNVSSGRNNATETKLRQFILSGTYARASSSGSWRRISGPPGT
jgi:3-hydroxyisobutyrate dehydrogenase